VVLLSSPSNRRRILAGLAVAPLLTVALGATAGPASADGGSGGSSGSGSSCTPSGAKATLLYYAGSRPTSLSTGQTYTFYYVNQIQPCSGTVTIDNPSGTVLESLNVTLTTSGNPPFSSLTAFNPQNGGSGPGSSPQVIGGSFTMPSTLPSGASTVQMTAVDTNGESDQTNIPAVSGSSPMPPRPFEGLILFAGMAGLGLALGQRRRTKQRQPA
jgi:hypothetical protein